MSYRGPDRRRTVPQPRTGPPGSRLALAVGGSLAVAVVAAAACQALGLGDELRPVADTLSIVATAFFFGAGLLRYARWKVTGEAAQAWRSVALLVFSLATFPMAMAVRMLAPDTTPSALGAVARLVSVLVVTAILVPGLRAAEVDAGVQPMRTAGTWLAAAVIGVVAVVLVLDAALPELSSSPTFAGGLDATAAAIWLVLGGLALGGGPRRSTSGRWAAAGMLLLGASAIVRAVLGDSGGWGWVVGVALLSLSAATIVFLDAGADAQTALSHEGRRLQAARTALDDAEELLTSWENRRDDLVHDARSMIAALRAASVTLDRHGDTIDPEAAHRLRGAMDVELERLGRLIGGSARDDVEVVDVHSALQPVVTTMREHGLAVDLDVEGARVLGRADGLAEVVRNLLVNACTHAPGSPVRISAQEYDGVAVILVEDRGPGVPDDLTGLVFERGVGFGPGAGSGLGLDVSRRLMRDQGGDLELRHRPGGGARFVLSLPAASPAMAEAITDAGRPDEDGAPEGSDASGAVSPDAVGTGVAAAAASVVDLTSPAADARAGG